MMYWYFVVCLEIKLYWEFLKIMEFSIEILSFFVVFKYGFVFGLLNFMLFVEISGKLFNVRCFNKVLVVVLLELVIMDIGSSVRYFCINFIAFGIFLVFLMYCKNVLFFCFDEICSLKCCVIWVLDCLLMCLRKNFLLINVFIGARISR